MKATLLIALSVIGCGTAAVPVEATIPFVDYSYVPDAHLSTGNPPLPFPITYADDSGTHPPTQAECPVGFQACGHPVVCCDEGDFHCAETDAGSVCANGAFVEPCDADCKSGDN